MKSPHFIFLIPVFPFSVEIPEKAEIDESFLSTFLGSLLPTSLLFHWK